MHLIPHLFDCACEMVFPVVVLVPTFNDTPNASPDPIDFQYPVTRVLVDVCSSRQIEGWASAKLLVGYSHFETCSGMSLGQPQATILKVNLPSHRLSERHVKRSTYSLSGVDTGSDFPLAVPL